jgi:hypothetical protein
MVLSTITIHYNPHPITCWALSPWFRRLDVDLNQSVRQRIGVWKKACLEEDHLPCLALGASYRENLEKLWEIPWKCLGTSLWSMEFMGVSGHFCGIFLDVFEFESGFHDFHVVVPRPHLWKLGWGIGCYEGSLLIGGLSHYMLRFKDEFISSEMMTYCGWTEILHQLKRVVCSVVSIPWSDFNHPFGGAGFHPSTIVGPKWEIDCSWMIASTNYQWPAETHI